MLQEELSAIGLALLIWLAGSISTKTKTAQPAIYRDPRLGSRASTSTWASFRPKSIAIRRVRSRPRNPPFFHGNGVSVNFTYLPDCSISSIVLTLILSVVTPDLSLNAYVRASIVRFGEPVMMAPRPFGAAVAFTELDSPLHWYLSRSFSLEACVTIH